jgi:hypothetical protein
MLLRGGREASEKSELIGTIGELRATRSILQRDYRGDKDVVETEKDRAASQL